MKYVDSLVSGQIYTHGQQQFVEGRITVSPAEYMDIEDVFQQIINTYGNLNPEQQEKLKQIQKILPRFRKDWRYREMEKEAKELLLTEALSLRPNAFEDLFPDLKHFLRRHCFQTIFEQVYLALNYNPELSPYKLDFVTRIYLERMSTVFELLKPYLTKKQTLKWEDNVAKKLKRF